MEVYLLVDDYTPDAGSTIYSAHKTRVGAEAALKELSNPDNEYGYDLNQEDTVTINILTLED